MIDDPGSFSGSSNSPIPHLGPEESILISFPIFISETAVRFNAPESSTTASCAAKASNLFSAVSKGKPVNSAIFLATNTSYPFGVFNPVPTAVPPNANSFSASNE